MIVKLPRGGPMNLTRLSALLLIPTILLFASAGGAAAHASKNSSDGKVRVTWGWLNEPANAGEKLRVDLVIRDSATGAGIGGLTAADFTELTLHYGEEEYALGNVTTYTGPKGGTFAGPGSYTASVAVIPTREGIYELHIKGIVNGSEVDLEIPASHALEYPEALAFPDPLKTNEALETRLAAMEAEIAALKAKAQTQSQTPATLTPQTPSPAQKGNSIPMVGLLALVAVLAFVALRKNQK